MRRLPLFTWINFVNAFIILMALPVLNAGLAMLLIDRLLDGHFFLPQGGGHPVLWQHIFWAFGHPEVYILVLPAFGIDLRDHSGFFPQTDFRLRICRCLECSYRGPKPGRLGTSHVYGGNGSST